MIRRNKNIFGILATGIIINMFLYAGCLSYVSAADLSEQNEVVEQSSSTTNIDGMIIENGVLISGKDAEGQVKIPSNVNKIASDAFGCNDKITAVEIPDGVTEIGMSAFTQCKNLTKVNIPGSVKVISQYAFNDCNLSDITIEDGVETIGQEAFSRCFNRYDSCHCWGWRRFFNYTCTGFFFAFTHEKSHWNLPVYYHHSIHGRFFLGLRA